MSKRPLAFASAVIALMCLLAVSSFAQGTTSRVTGTVTDTSGAAVAGVTVSLTREGVATPLTTQTGDDGLFVFDLVQPGTYTLTFEKAGFKKLVSSNNQVLVNQPATINAALEVGSVEAVVNVESTAEQVQTGTSGNVGSTIEQRSLEALPIVGLRGRNPLDLLNYQPGVVVGANTGGGVHVNGSRDRAFNFTLDGIDINESTAGGSNFTPLRPNPDSVQEFQIVTSNATAELGRSSGAQVTFVTRSGTNEYHGNIFEYYQTPDFNANEWESNLNGIRRRQFVQHIYGFSLGGPVPTLGFGEGTPFFKPLRDKAFFFINYQRLYATESRLVQRTVYTDLARQGIFRYVVGQRNSPAGSGATASVDAAGNPLYPACSSTVTTNCIRTYDARTGPISFDPLVSGIIRSYPLPNDFSRGDGLNIAGYNFNAPQLEKQWDLVMRFDYAINSKNHVYFRYAEGEQNTIGDSANGGLQAFPGFPNLVDTFRRPKNYALNYRWSPTAKFTNEAIFGLSRFRFKFATPEVHPEVPFVLNTINDAYTNFAYNARAARTFQFVDNVTMDFSPHIIKAGINFRFGRQFDDRSSAGGSIEPAVGFGAGSSDFSAWALPTAGSTSINSTDLTNLRSLINNMIGRIGSYSQGFVVDPRNPNAWAPAGTRWNWYAYYPEYDFYVQDTWRLKPNFVLDLGLRYEVKLSPSSKDLPILRANQNFVIGAPPSNTLRWEEGKIFPNDFNNFGPSVGFAWDPFKNGKTSIRANYRLSYDRFPSQVFANSIFQSAPGNTFSASASGIAQQNLLLRNGLPNLFPSQTPDQLRQPPAFSTSSITVVAPDTQYPEIHQWFAGIQREIWGGNVVEVDYIGKKGLHLFGGYDANQVNIFASDPRCPGQTFLDAFILARNDTSSSPCLINLLFTGSPTNTAGTTTFRGIAAIQSTLALTNTGGSVATAAQVVSQRTSGTSQMIATTIGNPFFFQKYPQFTGALNVLDSNDYSFYNGLEFIIKRRMKNGFGYQVGYTWSVSKDTRSFDPTFTIVSRANAQSASSTPFDINNRDLNYAWSDFDRRHVLVGTYVFELPFGRGRKFASDVPKALDWIIGGWQIAGTYLWGSGRPFTVYSGLNTFSNVNQSFANCSSCPRDLGRLVERNGVWYWFSEADQAKFSQPAPGELGNTGRNYFIGPRSFQTDMSLSKKFRFTESMNLELRVDAKNLTNNASFGLPTATFNSTVFGRIRDSVTSFARRVQISGKFNF
ncbi:MAG: carboxypeptidase regulatory-like domain-containing protein [Pyrinomonadaceae bacterium]